MRSILIRKSFSLGLALAGLILAVGLLYAYRKKVLQWA